jgi:hypothetical protein
MAKPRVDSKSTKSGVDMVAAAPKTATAPTQLKNETRSPNVERRLGARLVCGGEDAGRWSGGARVKLEETCCCYIPVPLTSTPLSCII